MSGLPPICVAPYFTTAWHFSVIHFPFRHIVLLTLLLGLALGTAACGADTPPPPSPTPTIFLITATLPPTQTPRPSPTPLPPTPSPPVQPVEGQTTSQLNVRSAPSASGDLLGTVYMFSKVQIVGKDASGGWYLIQFPESPSGTGWITAQFVQVSGSPDVPVIVEQPQPAATGAQAASTPDITGAGSPSSPEAGVSPAPAMPGTQSPAPADNDSSQTPAVSVTLSAAQVSSFQYSSDVSSPQGDADDWVQFTLTGKAAQPVTVSVMLQCTGNGPLAVELIQAGARLQTWNDIPCGQASQLILSLFAGNPYTLRILAEQAGGALHYAAYTVTVSLR